MPRGDPRPPLPPPTLPPPNASPRDTTNGGRARSSSNDRGGREGSRGPAPGGPRRSLHRGPEPRGEREVLLPRISARPRRPRAFRFPREVRHLLHGKAGGPPRRSPTKTLSSSGSLRRAARNSRSIGRAPDGPTGIGSWRFFEWCKQCKCPRTGTAAGRCERAQEPPLVFSRPAYPSLFPQAPWRPCRIVGCGGHGKCLTERLETPWPVSEPPSHPCPWSMRTFAYSLLFALCDCLCRCLALVGACIAQGCFRPGGGSSSAYCRAIGAVECVEIYRLAQDLCPRPRGSGGDSCPAAPAPYVARHGVSHGRAHHRGAGSRLAPGKYPRPAGAASRHAPRAGAPTLAAQGAARSFADGRTRFAGAGTGPPGGRRPARRQSCKGTRGPRAGRNAARSRPRQQRRVPQLSPPWPWERRPRERQCRPEGCRSGSGEGGRRPGRGRDAPEGIGVHLLRNPITIRPRAATPRPRRTNSRPPRRSPRARPPVGSSRQRGLGRRPGASLG